MEAVQHWLVLMFMLLSCPDDYACRMREFTGLL